MKYAEKVCKTIVIVPIGKTIPCLILCGLKYKWYKDSKIKVASAKKKKKKLKFHV